MTLVLETDIEFDEQKVSNQMRKILHGELASKDFHDSPVGAGYTVSGPVKVAEVEC